MPIIDLDTPLVNRWSDTPKGFAVTPNELSEVGVPPAASPGMLQTLGAAMRYDNPITATVLDETIGTNPEDRQTGFSAWDQIKGTPDEQHWGRFADVHNQRAFDARKRQIANEDDAKKTLAASPWYYSFPAELIAGVLDPTTLMPGGAFVKSVKGGYNVARSAMSVGLAAGTAVGVQELALHNTQQTRTFGESTINVGASVVLGSMVGAGGARLLSRAEWQKAVRDLEAPAVTADAVMPELPAPFTSSLGAAAVSTPDLASTAIAGKVASAVAATTERLVPALRVARSDSAVVRDVGMNLFEMSTYMRANVDGLASPQAAETLRKQWDAGLMQSVRETRNQYSEFLKSDIYKNSDAAGLWRRFTGRTASEFNAMVGQAMRRGDQHEIPQVAAAAQAWRKNVFDPLKDAAIEAKLLPADVSPETAISYFSRIWNRKRLVSEEPAFKGAVIDHYSKVIATEFEKSATNHNKRVAQLNQELEDLHLTPEARISTLRELETAQSYHEATRFELGDQAARLSEIATNMRLAKEANDYGAIAALRDERAKIIKEGGDELKTFIENRTNYRRRLRNVELGSAGLQERADRILTQLADLEEANSHAMERLVKKGQQLERDLDRLDADALQTRVDDIAASFEKMARRAESSAERAQREVANINKRAAAKEVKNIEKGAEIAAESDSKIATRLTKEAERQTAFSERMSEIAERLKAARDFDHDGLMTELRQAIEKATRETSTASLARGSRAERLGERLATLSPERIKERAQTIDRMSRELEQKFSDRWEVRNLGDGIDPANKAGANFSQAAREIADEVFDKLTGRTTDTVRPEFITITARGPLKERTFNIPDELIERWLEHDVDIVGRRYSRIMSADVEIARKFGSPDMKEALAKVREDYKALRADVTDAKALKRLDDGERADIRDLEGVRDLIRGTYMQSGWEKDFGRVVRVANALQYVLKMGGIVISSLTEPFRVLAAKGLMPMMADGFSALRNIDALKLSVHEAQMAGNIHDKVLAHRLATLADITDFYGTRTPIERFMDNATNVASSWNGIRLWTDGVKALAATKIQNDILDIASRFAKATDKEKRYLSFLGIDESMATRIAAQFAQHGDTQGRIRIAGKDNWTDDITRRAYNAALNKDLDSMVVTRGAADLPLFANSPLGRLLFQFNTFNLASHQRILLRGLQEGHARFLGTVVALSSMGMLMTYLKALSNNRADKLPNMAENPGWWIAEGLDQSGLFMVPMVLSNSFEKLTGMNPIKGPMKALDVETGQKSSRNLNRNELGVLGPSAGTIQDIGTVAGIPKTVAEDDDIKKRQMNAAERLIPFNSYPGMRQMLKYIVNPPE